ncbi:MAG: hypothetical protein ACTSRW_04220 [Candidatus Helarchaeota archaeon]
MSEKNQPPDSKKETAKNQEIPQEVLDQLPDHVKAELGVAPKPAPGPVFEKGDIESINQAMKRLSDAFEKIGLTLIGRMGEFATTLERMMMTVARIEKVENLVAEMKYFNKNLQKTMDELNRKLDRLDRMDISAELQQFKQLLRSAPIKNVQANATPAAVANPVQASSTNTTVATTTKLPIETKPQDETALMSAVSELDADLSTSSVAASGADYKAIIGKIFADNSVTGTDLINQIFDALVQIQVGEIARDLAVTLEKTKKYLSENYKWTPILYEMGKSARIFKARKTESLTQREIEEFKQVLDTWKQKLLEVK